MKQENSKVLVFGAAVIDIIIQVDKLPKTSEDVYGEHKQTMVGGCAYNVQQVIKQFDIDHTLFVPVGNGPYADIIRKQLIAKDTPVILEDDSSDNGWNISFVEADGERTFLTVPGLETLWKEEWFEHIHLSDYDIIYVSGYELENNSGEVFIRQLEKRKAPHTKIVFDPGPRVSYINEEVLEGILKNGTIVHCNESELKALYPSDSIKAAAQKLHAKTGEAVVITMGKEGCYYLDENNAGIVPAEKVKVVDTIGAGDSHTGAFISGLAQGYSIEKACKLGNDISARVIQRSGGTL